MTVRRLSMEGKNKAEGRFRWPAASEVENYNNKPGARRGELANQN